MGAPDPEQIDGVQMANDHGELPGVLADSWGLRARQSWKHHQINMTANRVAPLTEFLREGLMLLHLGVGFQILQPLVHKIKSVVDQLRGLFGSHDAGSGEYGGLV
ncbi:MAG: hypothetical protein VKO19_05230 [Cyanobacteriota bacterium]|nr:hypothetical protein [Cyanobacteriota bacterium]